MAHFWTVKEFLPAMIRNNHGHVVTVASMASFLGLGEIADYCTTKAGALAFHESLGQEIKYWYKAPKIRTSIIHPFWVATPMVQLLIDAGKHFKQPIMTPDQISSAVVKQVVTQRSGQAIVPKYLSIAAGIRGLPTWVQEKVRYDNSMALLRLRELEQQGVLQDKQN